MSGGNARIIKVVQFQNDFEPPLNTIELNRQPTKSTRQITLCLSAMPRYHRDYRLIYTKFFWINMNSAKIGFIFFGNPANSSSATEYVRSFSLCEPRVPGIWTSMCFGVSFTGATQLVRVFQEGKMCSERIYTEDFDFLYFPTGSSIETM